MTTNKPMTRRALVREISKGTLVKPDAVEDVLDRFIDIAIEEIANKGVFSMENFFSIYPVQFKGYKLAGKEIPDHERLRVKLSKKIRDLRKLKLGELEDEDGIIGRDNWRKAFQYFQDNKSKKTNDSYPENPMLGEDYDE